MIDRRFLIFSWTEERTVSKNLGGVGLANVSDSDSVNPAVLTAPRGKIAHILHDL